MTKYSYADPSLPGTMIVTTIRTVANSPVCVFTAAHSVYYRRLSEPFGEIGMHDGGDFPTQKPFTVSSNASKGYSHSIEKLRLTP